MRKRSVEPDSRQRIGTAGEARGALPSISAASGSRRTEQPKAATASQVASMSWEYTRLSILLLPLARAAAMTARWLMLLEGGTLTSP
jgi:hypothetical protein